ncbi:uncharacterized protein A1O9_00487 [Exophiala aquamarina CBS 119918]|uniref:Uncharacterized protein n=1 Tax=Exophiala aquamarina CBS 119918 TaxID=1182545 RepID=A0A072PQX2_9EURO|nr:uncharacterized protein A1O9_00487 [Exophiala aquamarina CBS 119918]KEF62514.1 hypothetical protein A1O9_00487 [Exophiala aquamarina CBS 119918]
MATTKTDFSTPDIPMSEAVWHVSACTTINAPASLVFRTLRNTETWKDWNRWIPRVTITDQPDDEDDATLAEIEELVRNTSIAVNFDSDLTDGAAMPDPEPPRRGSLGWGAHLAHSGVPSLSPPPEQIRTSRERPRSSEGMVLPPVTRQRLASNASKVSKQSENETSRNNSTNGGLPRVQKFQAAQDARKASVASGMNDSTPNSTGVMLDLPGNTSVLLPAPRNTGATALALAQQDGRRKSSASGFAEKKRLHVNALYGEPSVRIQDGTKMTFHVKIKIPSSAEIRDQNVSVIEVSRPDDPLDNSGPRDLKRIQTHTVSKSGVYRLVWSMDTKYNPPKSYPKFLLQAQRVHEIRPIVAGDGKEMCEYWQWEAQKGLLAKRGRKDHFTYYEQRMVEWGKRLGDFCESMGGAVERRDFVS